MYQIMNIHMIIVCTTPAPPNVGVSSSSSVPGNIGIVGGQTSSAPTMTDQTSSLQRIGMH